MGSPHITAAPALLAGFRLQLQEPVVVAAGIMVAVVLAGFAAMHVAGCYRHQTITQRLLASPRRGRTLAAELLVYGTVALLIAALTLKCRSSGTARLAGRCACWWTCGALRPAGGRG